MDFGVILLYVISYFGLFTSIFFLTTLLENKSKLKDPIPKRYPKITVMVPAYNEEITIRKTINSLLNLDYPKEKLEIIVVDDGSTDNTYQIMKEFEKLGVKIFSKENQGKAETLNFAIKRATGEFVGALDSDSFVDRRALKHIVGYFENPKVMAVTSSLKVWKTKGFLERIQAMEYLMGVFLRKIFALLGSIHVTPGPFTFYRKSFFDKYGLYDTNNITEDIEVALRMQSHNFIIENSVNAYVYTNVPKGFKSLLMQRIRWYRGFVDNVIQYRHLFGLKHGNLGMFILPCAFISVGLVIIALFYSIIKLTLDGVQNIINLYNIGFDIKRILVFDFDLFFVNTNSVMFFSMLAFAIGIIIIMFAKYISREKVRIRTHYLLYLLVYTPLFGLWWMVAFYYKLSNKKIKWGKKFL